VKDLDNIERSAVEKALGSKDLEEQSKAIAIADASRQLKYRRTQAWATALTPSFAVLLAALTLAFQTYQFSHTAKQQAEASLDLQWRESLKGASFRDPGEALASGLAMQSFFESDKYRKQARAVACTLLPKISNRDGFDLVLFDMVDHGTDESNEGQIVGVARMLLTSQRELYRTKAVKAFRDEASFDAVNSMLDTKNPGDFEQPASDSFEQARVGAWELDSASRALEKMWNPNELGLPTPKDKDLAYLALESHDFHGLDFSDVDFSNSIFFKSNFKDARLTGANLRGTLVWHVCLSGADLSGITRFEGSKWRDVDWQAAKAISPDLSEYITKNYIPPRPEEEGMWGTGPSPRESCPARPSR